MADRKRFGDRDYFEGGKPRLDDPPNSRLFIVCSKNITEDDFRTAFEKFGTIEEVWVVKDKTSGEPKGVTYIKFSKTSEAALALEEMNGKCIGSANRPLKVMIAHSRDQGSKRESNEEERLLRLFCVVPKTTTDQMLRDHFKQFGDIDYVSVVKDRETKESRGFAYVKYHKISHAAKAFENCDRTYKAVFAEPRKKNSLDSFDRYSGPSMGQDPMFSPFGSSMEMSGYPNAEGCNLRVIASPHLNQDQLWKLFDIAPGLDFLYLDPKAKLGKGHAVVVYNNPQAAAYAQEKLHGFEYPPGQRLIVKMDPSARNDLPLNMQSRGGMNRDTFSGSTSPRLPGSSSAVPTSRSLPPDLASLAETIAQATSLIQAAGLAPGMQNGAGANVGNVQGRDAYDPSYCSVKLPSPQPLASMDAETAERLFIVCNPGPPPAYALRDVFGRFGNLIDVYMLSGKNCGYAKYASKESAENAIQTLHGQEVCGIRMKVMAADPRTDDRRKRLKMEDQ
ncbi:hypothetical protein R5R35_000965 [Gryllus longicercus]|uniref:RRM domain-containing protein n=1 Tax=Gryllus longicercus TaxID=2509291 RepID=A0AAN9VCI3_9ORTH